MLYLYPRNKPYEIEAEVKAISELSNGKHHNLVRLLDFGVLKNGWFYFDMELCDFSLTDYIYDNKMVDGLPGFDSLEIGSKVQQIWDIMMQIAVGVTFIHERQYVHRGLKPNNSDSHCLRALGLFLVLYRDSKWKIADFGLSSPTGPGGLNETSQRRGSGGYSAPELLKGTYGRGVDIWSMGCILYEMASGKKAFLYEGEIWGYYFGQKSIQMSFDKIQSDERAKDCVSRFVSAMLCIEPSQRPEATYLYAQFSNHYLAGDNRSQPCCLHELEAFNSSSS